MARKANGAAAPKSDKVSSKETDKLADEVTRCICGNQEFAYTTRKRAMNAISGLYVQCERCNVWQHGFCMGFKAESEIPNKYYCELCEPEFHQISQKNGMVQSKYRPEITPQLRNGSHSDSPETNLTSIDESVKQNGKPRTQSVSRRSVRRGSVNHHSQNFQTSIAESNGSVIDDDIDEEQHSSEPDLEPKQECKDNTTHTRESSMEPNDAAVLDSADVSDETHDKSDVKAEEAPISSAQEASESNNEKPSLKQETKKRNGKPSPDLDLPMFRNRKRRSREDEILQRVLEESAREAREAESRRQSTNSVKYDENHNSDSEIDDRDRVSKRTRRSTAVEETKRGSSPTLSSSGSSTTSGQNKKSKLVGRPSTVRGRGRGRGGRGGSRQVSASGDSSSISPRKSNGGASRRCKPRIPSQRSTFEEMRKRVSSILDFSSRTQDELIHDQKTKISALEGPTASTPLAKNFRELFLMSQNNLLQLEELTSKLLKWREQYGVHSSP